MQRIKIWWMDRPAWFGGECTLAADTILARAYEGGKEVYTSWRQWWKGELDDAPVRPAVRDVQFASIEYLYVMLWYTIHWFFPFLKGDDVYWLPLAEKATQEKDEKAERARRKALARGRTGGEGQSVEGCVEDAPAVAPIPPPVAQAPVPDSPGILERGVMAVADGFRWLGRKVASLFAKKSEEVEVEESSDGEDSEHIPPVSEVHDPDPHAQQNPGPDSQPLQDGSDASPLHEELRAPVPPVINQPSAPQPGDASNPPRVVGEPSAGDEHVPTDHQPPAHDEDREAYGPDVQRGACILL